MAYLPGGPQLDEVLGLISLYADLIRRLLDRPDIYGYEEREPEKSINFVTCH
jgi:glycogen operon protein